MKKLMKKLTLTKETVQGLEKRDGLSHVVGGEYVARQKTVETGCNFCETGSCPTICCPA